MKMASLKCKEVLCLIYAGLLFISGILLITFSVILSYRIFYHYSFIPSGTIGPFIVIFILGFVHLCLTWLGIKGPPREHNFHIILFMIFTLILLVCEFTVGIWSMVLWNEVSVESTELMTMSFNDKLNFNQKAWFKLQNDLKCCGMFGTAKDATQITCINMEKSNDTNKYPYEDGCHKPIVKYAQRILIDGALIGFISGIYQVIGIFAFYTFFKALRQERSERIARRVALQREMSGQGQPGVGGHQSNPSTPLVTTPPPSATPPPLSTPPVTTSA